MEYQQLLLFAVDTLCRKAPFFHAFSGGDDMLKRRLLVGVCAFVCALAFAVLLPASKAYASAGDCSDGQGGLHQTWTDITGYWGPCGSCKVGTLYCQWYCDPCGDPSGYCPSGTYCTPYMCGNAPFHCCNGC